MQAANDRVAKLCDSHAGLFSGKYIYITLCSHDSDRMKCKQYVISNKRCFSRFVNFTKRLVQRNHAFFL